MISVKLEVGGLRAMARTEIVNRFNAIRLGEYRQINREQFRRSLFS